MALTPPAGAVLTRHPIDFASIDHHVPIGSPRFPDSRRVRFSFKGSATTAPGTVTQKVRIRRRFF